MGQILRGPYSCTTRRLVVWSALLTLGAVLVVAVTGRLLPLAFVWNLFLAWIPYGIGRVIRRLAKRTRHGTGLLVLPTALWMLFFPNAPYVVTDYVHVVGLPLGLALPGTLLIGGFAGLALLLGLLSLRDVHDVVRTRLGERVGWAFAGSASLFAALGIWIGRFLRWNSWDAFTAPRQVLRQTWLLLSDSPASLAFVLVMGVGLLAVYRLAVVRPARASVPGPDAR